MPDVLEKDKMTSKLRNIDQRKHIRKIQLWDIMGIVTFAKNIGS